MCTLVDSGEIIILSDDDEDSEEDILCCESSVSIVEVEDVKKIDCAAAPSSLDEDLVVTFSRPAEVLPHARYDCPIHPFTATDCDTGAPVAGNQLICDQCFCYICDKLASLCTTWSQIGMCHCNSHKKSGFWNNLRKCSLLGGLATFNLTLSEIDIHLRRAEVMLQSFRQELSAKFLSFMKGKPQQEYGQNLANQQHLVYDYTPVYEFVSMFLNEADKQDNRAAAILRLGAAEDFIQHFLSGSCVSLSPTADVSKAKVMLLHRVISSLQRQMVMADFTPDFRRKLQDFYKKFYFPAAQRNLRNSLCVRPWDDILLVSVLKGQNVSGVRKDRGKKDVLIEEISVVLLRVQVLQQQNRYRELCRYLRVVQADEPKCLQQTKDLIPFFMCMEGDFAYSAENLLSPVNTPASRFTPHLFLLYLRIFKTGTAPKLMVTQPVQLCLSDAPWQPIKGAVPLRRNLQVKFALRVQKCCSAVFNDSQCWTSVLLLVNTPLPEPNLQFLLGAKGIVRYILLDTNWSNLQIPRFFLEAYPDQALLLLVTGALGLRMEHSALRPVLPVLNTFKENLWALKWLLDMSFTADHLRSVLQEVTQEMENTEDGDSFFSFLRGHLHTQSSALQNWDHPVSIKWPPPKCCSVSWLILSHINSFICTKNITL